METKAPILNNKIFLYLTEFFSGMSVMAVELGASRLLAPYFSSSQIVWTIIIGTIMIAMALGNVFGGRSADKNPNPSKLYGRLLIAAVWTAAIPFFGKFVILGVSGILVVTVSTNFLIWAAFIACMIIFVYPCFLLGTVTPSLIKYTVNNLEDSGKTSGTLSAANTIGSIIGTFVPTFISIPAVGTAATFAIFSGILLILASVYFISLKIKTGIIKTIVAIILFIAFVICSNTFGFAFWDKNLTYEGESVYNYLQVKDNDKETVLSTNVMFGVQSVYMKTSTLSGMYYDYAMAAPYMTNNQNNQNAQNNRKNILILGNGSGTYARECSEYLDNVNIEGVEIDGKITKLARKYFKLSDSVKVTEYDGRAYLNVQNKKYDVIMVDAYQDITIPFQMSTKEFFTMVKNHLTDNGVMVVNMNMKTDSPNGINTYLEETIASVFPNVYTADVKNYTNRELFASNGNITVTLSNNIGTIANENLRNMMSTVSCSLVRYNFDGNKNKILTDNKAPVELLGMRAIDGLISDELSYYKQVFKKDGIKGILEVAG